MTAPINPGLSVDQAAAIAKTDPVMSQNTEPGFANTYTRASHVPDGQLEFAVPLVGIGALGTYLLYRKYLDDQKARQESEKQAKIDWQAVRAQLPGIHAPDILLGGAAGAGAGLLYDYIRGAEKGKRMPTALRRALTGALVGAGGANLVGDRFRRYVTNSIVPATYDADSALSQLTPRSWSHVYDAAIKDKPTYDSKAVQEFSKSFRNSEVAQRVLTARRELDRIGMGVHLHDPRASIWQRNKTDKGAPYYSLNEKNKDYLKNLAAVMLPSRLSVDSLYSPDDPAYLAAAADAGLTPEQTRQEWNANAIGVGTEPYSISDLFFNPLRYLRQTYSKTDNPAMAEQLKTDLFGTQPLLGAQQIAAEKVGPNVRGSVLDRHDITPTSGDMSQLSDAILRGKVLSKDWRNQAANSQGYTGNKTNYQAMKATLGRLAWDRVLRHENPWVAQKFQFAPKSSPQEATGVPEYTLQMLKQDNTPAFAPMSRENLGAYLYQLQNGKFTPPTQ